MDRIAIIADGELIEEGTPRDIYERPLRRFTADFIGDNNLLDGRVTSVNADRVSVDLGFARVDVEAPGSSVVAGANVCVSVRSELMQIAEPGHKVDGTMQTIPGSYVDTVYLGLTTSHLVSLPNGAELAVRRISEGPVGASFEPGDKVMIGWKTDDARLHTE